MLNFLLFLYLRAFKISCSAELSILFSFNLGTWVAVYTRIQVGYSNSEDRSDCVKTDQTA